MHLFEIDLFVTLLLTNIKYLSFLIKMHLCGKKNHFWIITAHHEYQYKVLKEKNIKYYTEGGGGVSDYLDCSSYFIRQNGLISQNGENTLSELLEAKYWAAIVTDQSFENSADTSALTSPSSSISIIWLSKLICWIFRCSADV